MSTAAEAIRKRIAGLKEANEQLLEDKEELNKEKEQIKDQLDQAEAEKDDYRRKYEHAESKAEDLEDKLAAMRKDLDEQITLRDNAERELTRKTQAADKDNDTLSQLEDMNRALKDKGEEDAQTIEALNRQLQVVSLDIEKAEEYRTTQTLKESQQNEESQELNHRLQAAENSVTQLQDQENKLEAKIASLQAKLAETERDLEEKSGMLTTAERNNNQLEKELEDVKAERLDYKEKYEQTLQDMNDVLSGSA